MGIRSDVNLLGRTLGQVLKEQEGEAFFDLVERTRALVREVRAGGDDAELRAMLAGLSGEDAGRLARAFTWYFQLVNLAEEYERVRVLRANSGVRPQSLESALTELQAQGLSAADVEALIERLDLGLTFTAHPTEMRRRTIRQHLEAVARDLPQLDDPEAQDRVAAHVEAMWATPELRHLKPTVQDEVKGGLNYMGAIAGALPELQRDLGRAFRVSAHRRARRATTPSAMARAVSGADPSALLLIVTKSGMPRASTSSHRSTTDARISGSGSRIRSNGAIADFLSS